MLHFVWWKPNKKMNNTGSMTEEQTNHTVSWSVLCRFRTLKTPASWLWMCSEVLCFLLSYYRISLKVSHPLKEEIWERRSIQTTAARAWLLVFVVCFIAQDQSASQGTSQEPVLPGAFTQPKTTITITGLFYKAWNAQTLTLIVLETHVEKIWKVKGVRCAHWRAECDPMWCSSPWEECLLDCTSKWRWLGSVLAGLPQNLLSFVGWHPTIMFFGHI